MKIFELNDKIQQVYGLILLKDTSFEAKVIIQDLKNLYLYLDDQDGHRPFDTLFKEKYFRTMIQRLFPTAPIGFGNYYNTCFNVDEKDQVSSLQDILHKIYNEI